MRYNEQSSVFSLIMGQQLNKNGSLELIHNATRRGRPSCTDIAPGTVLRHFLYKSRGNVQFVILRFKSLHSHFA